MSAATIELPLEQLINLEKIKKKKINIAIFGHGNVGSHLVNQIISSKE